MIAPRAAPSRDQAEAVRAFLGAGNTVVVADDFNRGSDYLAAIGATIRFGAGNLSSLDRAYETPTAPFGFPAPGAPVVANLTQVIFDRPVAVLGGDPVLETSRLSWIDADGSGRIEPGEPLGRFTLAAGEPVGGGRVVALGDASLFINAMDRVRGGDNRAFLDHLLGERSVLVVEQGLSRTVDADGMINTILWVQGKTILILAIAALALIGVVLLFRRNFSGERDTWTR